MEKKIIISGTPKAIGNIVRENRIRENRGEISIREIQEEPCAAIEEQKPEQETPGVKEPEAVENKPEKRTTNK